jgi:nitrite reductase/ring-hydroxylating ferredoxin subunit
MRKLQIELKKDIPFSFYDVLSQYYDYEHIEHVHSKSLGRYELCEETENYISYRHIWPSRTFGQAESIVRHYHEPPNRMRFEFVEGRHKGTVVRTTLIDNGDSTQIREIYEMNLPGWPWLKPLIKPFVQRSVDRIWDEDLAVHICHDGWPGIPNLMLPEHENSQTPNTSGTVLEVPVHHLVQDRGVCVQSRGVEIVIFKIGDEVTAMNNKCPHSGGPLTLGKVEEGHIRCPWHGRRFCLKTGQSDSAKCDPVTIYPCHQKNDTVSITID